jgi:hypothetical protein
VILENQFFEFCAKKIKTNFDVHTYVQCVVSLVEEDCSSGGSELNETFQLILVQFFSVRINLVEFFSGPSTHAPQSLPCLRCEGSTVVSLFTSREKLLESHISLV